MAATYPFTKTPRWIERRRIEAPEHFQALDTDVDNIEAALQLAAAQRDLLGNKMDTINARLFGVLVSLISTAALLAGNLVFHH